MKHSQWMLLGLVLMSCLPVMAMADEPLPLEQIEKVLVMAERHGFLAFREIESKDRGRVEIDGWHDDEWYAEAEFDLADGRLRKEERERRSGGSRLSADDVRMAVAVAAREGMTHFHEIEISRSGIIEVEGRDAAGRELEVRIRQSDQEPVRVELDLLD